jgi:hypothetical protein
MDATPWSKRRHQGAVRIIINNTFDIQHKENNLHLNLLKKLLEFLVDYLMNLLGHLLSAGDSLL